MRFVSEGGVLYNKTKTELHTFPAGKSGAFSIPGSVTGIGENAFVGCAGLTSIAIPGSMTGIGDWAFAWCTSLTSVAIPGSVTSIGWGVFQDCAGLTSIAISGSVTSIGAVAFWNCSSLRDVTVEWPAPLLLETVNGYTVFEDVPLSAATLHVPAGTLALYKAANGWKDFGTIVDDVAAGQEEPVVVEPSQPEGDRGTIGISLSVPVNETFTVTFTLSLPAGFLLNPGATALVADLLSRFELEITPNGSGGWLFAIRPRLSTLSADETEYRQLVQIAYTMDETVEKGEYEVTLNDVNLTLDGGEVIHQDEIRAPVTVTTSVGNAAIGAAEITYHNGTLTVNTPVAEQITVYSLSGAVMYSAQKVAGEARFNLNSQPKGVLIAIGSSGWTRKVVISD
ncbi:MAG: leucine-rich repeat domain-containing protein [Tannerella sp.]|jgi:hypothetical protein|nr:leucine-rich repeat domain-containing protein [Tannerella sp.]